MSRSIKKEIIILQNADATFDALITPSLIKKWWLASGLIVNPRKDGLNITIWADDDRKSYISEAKIKEFKRPERLLLTDIKYSSHKGHIPFLMDTNAEFVIRQNGDKVKLTLQQTGFPDDEESDDFYQACMADWEKTLLSLKQVAEKNIPSPKT